MATATAALPDVNAQTYPFDLVQHLLDQTTSFSAFAVPDAGYRERTLTPDHPEDYFGINGGYGIDVRSGLHHFDATILTGRSEPFAVSQKVGEEAGSLRCRLLFGPLGFPWAASGEPPCSIYDPWRAQRFAIRDCEFRIGREDWFEAYGIGRTYPATVEGKPLVLAAAMGNLMRGHGRFHGLEGTFTVSGRITDGLGFAGNVTIRVVDPEGRFRSDRDVSLFSAIPDPEPEATFLVMRLLKESSAVKTTYGPPPGGGLVSLVTPSQIRSVHYGFVAPRYGPVRTEMRIGPVAGRMEADVHFDLLAPPGTAEKPVPFSTQEVYTFTDPDGRVLGTVEAAVEEGWAFNLQFPVAPGQAGVRFAGVGPLKGGTGLFEGAQGVLSVNSVIGIAPHALSLVHVIQLRDPHGRYRTPRQC
jgi:hypothetical protein